MSTETIVAIIGAVVAIISAVVAIVAGWAAWRQAGKANKSADRSAAAGERAAAAAEHANQFAEAQANKYVPKWTLSFDAGSQYILQNDSDRHAYGVTLASSSGPQALIFRDEGGPRSLAPGDSFSFFATGSASVRNTGLTLTWHLEDDLSDPPSVQRLVLPSRN